MTVFTHIHPLNEQRTFQWMNGTEIAETQAGRSARPITRIVVWCEECPWTDATWIEGWRGPVTAHVPDLTDGNGKQP